MSGTEIRLFHVGDASSPRQTTVLPFQIDLFCAIHRVGLAGLVTVQNGGSGSRSDYRRGPRTVTKYPFRKKQDLPGRPWSVARPGRADRGSCPIVWICLPV